MGNNVKRYICKIKVRILVRWMHNNIDGWDRCTIYWLLSFLIFLYFFRYRLSRLNSYQSFFMLLLLGNVTYHLVQMMTDRLTYPTFQWGYFLHVIYFFTVQPSRLYMLYTPIQTAWNPDSDAINSVAQYSLQKPSLIHE
jgi:hypothetical protein